MKKIKSAIKNIFNEFFTPKLPEPRFTLVSSLRVQGENESERNHRENVETMMVANLELQWEAQRRTLVLVQRTAIISILSVIVSIGALVVVILKG